MYEKFVLTEDGMYVEKDYLSDGLLKMNVITIVPPIMNNKNTYVIYLFESFHLWHGRLGHVNYEYLCRLININYLPKFNIDTNYKCETCMDPN